MIKIVLLSFLITLAIAANPKVYSALGDIIYDNVDNIEKLKELPQYSSYKTKIDTYVKEVNEAKKMGYAVESGNSISDKSIYLEKIRTLSKTNDFFQRSVLNSYKSSMENKENEFFLKIVNSGLLDTAKYKDEILKYYNENSSEMNASGVIQSFIDEKQKSNVKINKPNDDKTEPTRKQIQEAKIKRIRLKDKQEQELIQKKLEKELLQKKSEIIKEQVQELSKPN